METKIRPPKTMFELYKSLPEGTLCQLINNQIIMSPSPLDIHQKILGKIFVALVNFVETNNAGEVRIAPYDVHINKKNVYRPDIVFISNANLHKIEEDGLYGAPDMVIEILSPSTSTYDLEDKKDTYEQYGVKEYWVVDPSSKYVQGFVLENNEYIALPMVTATITSSVLNYSFLF